MTDADRVEAIAQPLLLEVMHAMNRAGLCRHDIGHALVASGIAILEGYNDNAALLEGLDIIAEEVALRIAKLQKSFQ